MEIEYPIRWRTPMEDAPHAAKLGKMLANFATLENRLTNLFAASTGTSASASGVIWREILSIPPKLKIMTRLIGENEWAEDEKAAALELISRAETINSRRNKLVHATWMAGPDAETLGRKPNIPPRGKKEEVIEDINAAELNQFADSIGILAWDIDAFLDPRLERNPGQAIALGEPQDSAT